MANAPAAHLVAHASCKRDSPKPGLGVYMYIPVHVVLDKQEVLPPRCNTYRMAWHGMAWHHCRASEGRAFYSSFPPRLVHVRSGVCVDLLLVCEPRCRVTLPAVKP